MTPEGEIVIDGISLNPGRMGGLPCIEGTRMPVAAILCTLACEASDAGLRHGVRHYDGVYTPAQVRACLRYAAALTDRSPWGIPAEVQP